MVRRTTTTPTSTELAPFMPLLRKIRTFRRLRAADPLLVAEAAVCLGVARALVLTVRFGRLTPWLSRAPESAGFDADLARRVCGAVTIAARNVPWKAVCLPQAMAAKFMLGRRGCGSSFHLGAGFDQQREMFAHAWLESGGKIVIGDGGMAGITPLAKFG